MTDRTRDILQAALAVAAVLAVLLALVTMAGCTVASYRDGLGAAPASAPNADGVTALRAETAPAGPSAWRSYRGVSVVSDLFGHGPNATVASMGSVKTDRDGAEIGGFLGRVKQASRVPVIMALAGVAFLAGAVLLAWLGRSWIAAGITAAAGGGLLWAAAVVETYPLALLAVPAAAVVLLVVLALRTAWGKKILADLTTGVRQFAEVVIGGEAFKAAVAKAVFVDDAAVNERVRQKVIDLFKASQKGSQNADTQDAVKAARKA